ncbi:unnamed protein product, partial [Staurois parvus]
MDTDRWRCWGYTDHQGTLIISALMISAHVSSAEGRLPALLCSRAVREMPITGISLFTCDQLDTAHHRS